MEVVGIGVVMVLPTVVCDKGRICLGRNCAFVASRLKSIPWPS